MRPSRVQICYIASCPGYSTLVDKRCTICAVRLPNTTRALQLRGENFLKSCLLKSECISFYVHALIDWEANMNHTWIMISRVKIFFLIPSSQLDH